MPYAYAFHETMASLLVDMVPLSDDDPLEMTTQREIAYQMAMLYRFAFKTMSSLADREEARIKKRLCNSGPETRALAVKFVLSAAKAARALEKRVNRDLDLLEDLLHLASKERIMTCLTTSDLMQMPQSINCPCCQKSQGWPVLPDRLRPEHFAKQDDGIYTIKILWYRGLDSHHRLHGAILDYDEDGNLDRMQLEWRPYERPFMVPGEEPLWPLRVTIRNQCIAMDEDDWAVEQNGDESDDDVDDDVEKNRDSNGPDLAEQSTDDEQLWGGYAHDVAEQSTDDEEQLCGGYGQDSAEQSTDDEEQLSGGYGQDLAGDSSGDEEQLWYGIPVSHFEW